MGEIGESHRHLTLIIIFFSIPHFNSEIHHFTFKVKKLTAGIEDQFLPLLEGNSSNASPMPEVNSSLQKCKMMNSGIEVRY